MGGGGGGVNRYQEQRVNGKLFLKIITQYGIYPTALERWMESTF